MMQQAPGISGRGCRPKLGCGGQHMGARRYGENTKASGIPSDKSETHVNNVWKRKRRLATRPNVWPAAPPGASATDPRECPSTEAVMDYSRREGTSDGVWPLHASVSIVPFRGALRKNAVGPSPSFASACRTPHTSHAVAPLRTSVYRDVGEAAMPLEVARALPSPSA